LADIFISYSSKNVDIAKALASQLHAGGFSVWWDTSLIAGDKFSDVIAREVDKAQAVIVIWSPESVKSDWVRWEATRAHDRGVLIPIMTSGVPVRDIPAPFSILQTELISNRDGIFAAIANLRVRRSIIENQNSTELSEHLVILVHGINTRALWMGKVRSTLELAGFAVGVTSFGKYSLFRFLMPFQAFRRRPVERVLGDIKTALALYERKARKRPEKVSVISHSFGTYVVAKILADHDELNWYRIIFVGSVVREDFDFGKVIDRFDDPLLSEVGTRDFWPALAESAGWGYGSIGSTQLNRPGTVTRWHKNYSHGDFLTPEFCNEFWVPFLRGEAPKAAADPTPMPLWVRILSALPLRWAIPFVITLGAGMAVASFPLLLSKWYLDPGFGSIPTRTQSPGVSDTRSNAGQKPGDPQSTGVADTSADPGPKPGPDCYIVQSQDNAVMPPKFYKSWKCPP
jgi:pimeloyl-ACP methyl ester carboxylesterase